MKLQISPYEKALGQLRKSLDYFQSPMAKKDLALYALSESSLPVKVDVVEWSRTSPAFREIILQNHVVLNPKNVQ